MPDCKTEPYSTITPINTFRLVLNSCFGQDFEYIEDKTIPVFPQKVDYFWPVSLWIKIFVKTAPQRDKLIIVNAKNPVKLTIWYGITLPISWLKVASDEK